MSVKVQECRTFTVVYIKKPVKTPKGRYVECLLDNRDRMAFWGGLHDTERDNGNLRKVQAKKPDTFTVTADRFRMLEDKDRERYPVHDFWVPQDAQLTFVP